MAKEYEMLFRLNAQVGPEYRKSFQSAQQELREITKRIEELKQEQKDISAYQKQQEGAEATAVKLRRLQQQYDNIQREIEETGTFSSTLENKLLSKQMAIDSTSASLEKQKKRLEELRAALEKAGTDMDDLGASSSSLAGKIDTLKKEQEQAAQASQNFGAKASQSLSQIHDALAAAGIAAAIKEIYQYFMGCAQASMEFESAITGVAKTTDLTDEELAAMADSIRALSTEIPATTEEISAVAEAAGQLGIQKDSLLDFTETMVMLGTSTNMTADEAATALARFANITGTGADEYGRLGSTIVDLGNNFATTEREITEMATRLASAGTLAGISEPGILALAAAMSSVGIEAEAGGTAMTETMNAIETAVANGAETLDRFADIAGMGAQDFAALWKNDALSALTAFIGGLGQLDEQGESTVLVLEDLGLTGVRQSNMLKSLGLAADQMSGAVELANDAWEENTALTSEASKRYQTTQSQLIMLQNSYNNLEAAIGDTYTPALKNLSATGADILDGTSQFIRDNPALVKAVVTFTGVIGGATAAVAAATAAINVFKIASKTAAATIPGLNIIMGVTAGIAALSAAVVFLNEATSGEAKEIAGLTATSRAQYAELQNLQAEYDEVCASMGDTSAEAQLLKAELDEASAAFEEQKQTAEELAAAQREAIDAHNELMASYEEAAGSLEKETSGTESLITRLEQLMATEKKSAAAKQEILAIVDLLNEAVPQLGLAYNQYADSLNLSADAIRGIAEAELTRERNAENYKQMKSFLNEQNTLYETLQASIAETTAREEELAQAQKAYQEAAEENGWEGTQNAGSLQAATSYITELQRASDALKEAEMAESEARAAYEENQTAIKDLSEAVAGYTEEMGESGRAVQDLIAGITSQAGQLASAYQEAYETASETISGQYQLWDKAAEVAAVGAEEIRAALESQAGYWQSYNENLESLAVRGEKIAGLSEMIGSFADGSASSVNAVAGMAAATDEELAAMVESWRKLQEEQDNAANGLANLKTDFAKEMDELQVQLSEDITAMEFSEDAAESGRATIQGFVDGAAGMLPQVQTAYRRIANAANAALSGASRPSTSRGYASGTASAPPGWAWVGEKGPELMLLRGGETILPAEASQEFAQTQQELLAVSFAPELSDLLAARQALNTIPAVEALPSSWGGVTVSFSPSYQISGSTNAEELRAVLSAHDEELIDRILRTLEEAEMDTARRVYR